MRVVSPNMQSRKLFVSFKVSEVCNMGCNYCYFFFKGDESYKEHPPYITPQMVEHVGRFLAEGAADLEIPTVSVALHGGEPLMVGKSRMRAYCEVLKRQVSPHATLTLGVQTNGLLVDEEWIQLFSDCKVGVGISIDGPKAFNDAVRIDKRGRGTYDRVVKAIRLLQKSAQQGLIKEPGALAVIRPGMSARALYQHIVYDLNFRNLDFMLPKDSWDNYSPERLKFIEEFSLELMECWLEDDNPEVGIRMLKQIFAPFLTDVALECRTDYLADLTEAITIRSNGDVSPDDTLPAVAEEYRNTGYNVTRSTLREFYSNPLWDDIRNTVFTPPEVCRRCEWMGFCGGGEIVTRYSRQNKFNNPTIYCNRNKLLYDRVRKYISGYMDINLIADRMKRSRELMFNQMA